MTDQGRGYGAEPWGQGNPYHGGQQQGGVPYGAPNGYPQQPGWGAPQQVADGYPGYQGDPNDPYGTGQYPPYPQQQQPVQQPVQSAQQQPVQPVAQQSAPVLGPDGIDWEAEAAALEAEAAGADQPVEELYEEAPAETYEDSYDEDEDGYTPFLSAPDESRSGERRRKQMGKSQRKRSGVACLGMSLLMVAVLGGGGYYGYTFYQKHWGPPADYAGGGSGLVTVTIPLGATGDVMGQTLFNAGVVKSIGAFDSAYNKNSNSTSIQPGTYSMPLHMSAADAVDDLIKQNGGLSLTIPEGLRATDIYARIDKGLNLKPGTTAAAAKADVAQLGLPSYANGNIEGFLWPTRYSIVPGMKPEALLQQMVSTAQEEFSSLNISAGASGVKLKSGYQVLIEASILQAEGNNVGDFGKIARVLYNRLNTNVTNGQLQLDSTLAYYLGTDQFDAAQRQASDGGYNTYVNVGLPPGPISNPGQEAINAVLSPTPGAWNYFIAVTPGDTQFADTWAQFLVYDQQYCTINHQGFNATEGVCVP
jgi:UPF0755 protein